MKDAKHMRKGDKKDLVVKIKSNRELHSQWSMLSDDSVHMVVLDMIIDLYITIRGFAFAASCLELYKQRLRNHYKNQNP